MIRPAAPLALLALLAPLSLAACAEAPPPAAPEAAPPAAFAPGQPREVSPIDKEMLAIGHAEEEIDRAFPAPVHGKKGALPPPPPPETMKGGSADQAGPEKPARAPGAKDEAGGGDACSVACRALSSMVASADRLCKLSGENDGRCDDARARVRGAMSRVKTACPGCTVTPPAPEQPRTPPKAPPTGPAPGMPGSSTGVPIP